MTLTMYCPFQGKVRFADPDWIRFQSDFHSLSNGKNNKLNL